VVALVFGAVIGSLSASGIITMTLAWWLLGTAWLIGTGASFYFDHLWCIRIKHRVIWGIMFGCLLFVIGKLEEAHQPQSSSEPASTLLPPRPSPMPPAGPKSTLPYISVNCEFSELPAVVPPSGKINIYQIFWADYPIYNKTQIGIGYRVGDPGSKWEWFSSIIISEKYKCIVINHGDIGMFDVVLHWTNNIESLDKEQNRDQIASNVIAKQPVIYEIPELEPGASGAFEFYIFSQSKYFLFSELSDMADASYGTDNVRIEVPVRFATPMALGAKYLAFNPAVPAKHPQVQSQPVQSPAPLPAGK
jgi:hypothetical protein